MRAPRPKVSAQMIRLLPMPVLVVAGENDTVSGSAEALAGMIPNGKALILPGKDHMSAVGDRLYKAEVLKFLNERP
jgi:pimeloyl-ACP methyl ester carboxylesterase